MITYQTFLYSVQDTHSLIVVKDYNSLTLFADHSLPDYDSFLENIMKIESTDFKVSRPDFP